MICYFKWYRWLDLLKEFLQYLIEVLCYEPG